MLMTLKKDNDFLMYSILHNVTHRKNKVTKVTSKKDNKTKKYTKSHFQKKDNEAKKYLSNTCEGVQY